MNNLPVWEGDSPIFPAGKSGQSPSYSSAAGKEFCTGYLRIGWQPLSWVGWCQAGWLETTLAGLFRPTPGPSLEDVRFLLLGGRPGGEIWRGEPALLCEEWE